MQITWAGLEGENESVLVLQLEQKACWSVGRMTPKVVIAPRRHMETQFNYNL